VTFDIELFDFLYHVTHSYRSYSILDGATL